jgi:hypothetical protein
MLTRRFLGRSLLWAATCMAGAPTVRFAIAGTLTKPNDKPILSITGRISVTNDGETARFDRAMLEALGTSSFETSTPWYNGLVRFEGVPMHRLMEEVGATGSSLVAYALNDYSTEIPMEDFTRYPVMLALKRNGAYMPVRDKGPLFIVYPYDSSPELKHQKYYSRSAWQVAKMVVK